MSREYDEYLEQHRKGVADAFFWMRDNIPDIFGDKYEVIEQLCVFQHDSSKYDKFEYNAYDNYFYGNRSTEVVENFDYAWLDHIHKNPHHWQHWVLINDDNTNGPIALDMPKEYIIEMICDWWSFSWKDGNLEEIFKWYESHKYKMILSDETRVQVEAILLVIEIALFEEGANEPKRSVL